MTLWRGFSGSSAGKESACSAGDPGLIPGLGRSPGGGHGNPLQYSCLENPHGMIRRSRNVSRSVSHHFANRSLVLSLDSMSSFFFKFYCIFKIYIIVLVLPNIKMNPPQVYMCSPSWTLLPPHSPYHPSGSSQCTSPKHPVPCVEPGLAARFLHDILHVSMSFSQIFPPSPSPTESIRLFYMPSCTILFQGLSSEC